MPSLTLRCARPADCRFLWRVRNDADTRAASFDASPIPYASHRAWYSQILSSPATAIAVILDPDKKPIGYVRFDRDAKKRTVLSIALNKPQRGKGLGRKALRQGARWIARRWEVSKVLAYVKAANIPSCRAFTAAGFSSTGRLRRVKGQHALLWEKTFRHAD